MNDPDSRDGFLTPNLREYLRHEYPDSDSVAPGTHRVNTHRLRKRIRDAYLDFGLIFSTLESRDRRQILAPMVKRTDNYKRTLEYGLFEDFEVPEEVIWDSIQLPEHGVGIHTEGMRSGLAFSLLVLLEELVVVRDVSTRQAIKNVFEDFFENALRDAVARGGTLFEPRVTVDLESVETTIDDLLEKRARGESLSDAELEWLVHAREVEYEEIVDRFPLRPDKDE